MKLLFADIDGVLVTKEWGTPNWNKEAIKAFKSIFERTEGINTVLSSTWRHKPHLIYEFIKMIKKNKIKTEVIGMTPDIGLLQRDNEILAYLEALAKSRIMLGVKDYVKQYFVIDDDRRFFNDTKWVREHVQFVSSKTGYDQTHADYIIDKFNNGGIL